MAAYKMWILANNSKTICVKPDSCMKHEYKIDHKGHFDTIPMSLSFIVLEI